MRFLLKRSCGERLSKETLLKVDWRHTSKAVTGVALNRSTPALKYRNGESIDHQQTAPPRLQFSQPRRNFRADFVSCKGGGCALKLLGTPVFGPGAFFCSLAKESLWPVVSGDLQTAVKVPAVAARSVRLSLARVSVKSGRFIAPAPRIRG
jgi:hypothetical protein